MSILEKTASYILYSYLSLPGQEVLLPVYRSIRRLVVFCPTGRSVCCLEAKPGSFKDLLPLLPRCVS